MTTTLSRFGLTYATVTAVAEWYDRNPSNIYRLAVGLTAYTKANPGMIRTLLHEGWKPPGGLRDVHTYLDNYDKPMRKRKHRATVPVSP